MVRGEGIEIIENVTPQEVFDFVLDPAQYTKAAIQPKRPRSFSAHS